jgi:hypothetical protein
VGRTQSLTAIPDQRRQLPDGGVKQTVGSENASGVA